MEITLAVRDRQRGGQVKAQQGRGGHSAPKGATGAKPGEVGRAQRFFGALPSFAIHLLLPAIATFVLTWPLYAPWSWWPFAYVAFVPWLVSVVRSPGAKRAYGASYLLGAAFFLLHWRWLFITTPPGYLAGSFAFGLYFVLAAWLVRHLRYRRRLPVTFGFAVAWILVEIMRSRGPLAFPWFLLGHTQIRLLSVVQIADITGVYGISLAVAMVNGLLADVLVRWFDRRGARVNEASPASEGASAARALPPLRAWTAAPVVVVLTLASFVCYGWYRLSTLEVRPGPRTAVLQADFLLSAEYDPKAPNDSDKQRAYVPMIAQASREKAELVVLPETPWSMNLNAELLAMTPQDLMDVPERDRNIWDYQIRIGRYWRRQFETEATRHNTTIVVGAMSQEKRPAGTYPSELRYNSAFVFRPNSPVQERYDKINLVMFGEFVPFRYSLPTVYRWINGLTPWGADGYEYSLTPGETHRVFELEGPSASTPHRFAVTICYEDVIPQVFRRFMLDADGRKRVDFMLNISNDGWFGHGAQQAQHLVNCAFRAIENRVGVARSVNTGISGFVRPDGSWHDLVGQKSERLEAGGQGYRVAQVEGSPSVTFYSRYGDVFGIGVALLGAAAVVDAIVSRRRERRALRRSMQEA